MVSVHKPGAFKQSNKTHKTGKHRSKGAIDSESKGRRTSSLSAISKSNRKWSKLERKHRAEQIRKHKTSLVKSKKLAYSSMKGHFDAPPICATVISLDEESSPAVGMVQYLMNCQKGTEEIKGKTPTGVFTHVAKDLKGRFVYLTPNLNDVFQVLDAVKISDVLVLIWPLDGQLTRSMASLLSCVLSQGIPAVANTVRGFCALPPKRRPQAKKAITKLLEEKSLDAKYHVADTNVEGVQLLRLLLNKKRHETSLQQTRSLLLVDDVKAELDASTNKCNVQLTGYIRGRPLNVNHLVHVAGWSDFQMKQIDLLPDPMKSGTSETSEKVLAVAESEKQWTLEGEAEVDDMAGEQTWPSAQELKEASQGRKLKKKVKDGTSEYQAAWIPDEDGDEAADDDDEDSSGSEDDDEEMGEDDEESESGDEIDQVEMMSTAPSNFDRIEDEPIDPQDVEMYRQQRQNEMFPDEVDTPIDQDARVRFQKYRGLKSFRTSEWDAKENLPMEYARIFQFENFKRAKKRALTIDEESKASCATHGMYVRLHLINVPKVYVDEYESNTRPLLVVGLLAHEQRMSLSNVLLRRHHNSKAVVKSKQPVLMQMGYRRFTVSPVYSQHNNGNKHKFERFLPANGVCVASFYAPIMYPPASLLVFHHETHSLLATGSVLNNDPDRVIVKKAVLSGNPFKIHSKSVVVRYMFFNPEDVLWFKPIELRTRYGRRGHIVESLGTHGLMKCRFDGKVTQQDTVMMNLYKRVFPKWTYDEHVVQAPIQVQVESDESDDEDNDEMQCD